MTNVSESAVTTLECDESKAQETSENATSSMTERIDTAVIKRSYLPISFSSSVVDWKPSPRRVAIATGKAGISIATGILSISPALNVAVSAATVLFESIQAIQDYRLGVLNKLGYRTSSLDVGLRIGKEVAQVGTGVLIGSLVGLGIGLTSLPLVGQLVLTGVISVGLGICVGALLTRYADRAVIRLQIRAQYKYPRDEKRAQERFEQILNGIDDLSSMETCRIVQHYIDYRIASGWEDACDRETYQEAGYPIELLPMSLQHFTAVRLQRKWGFLRNRGACKKVFRALMLQHHPDRGGNSVLAAQLSTDFEIYAFCRQWWSDCRSILVSPNADEGKPQKSTASMQAMQSLWKIIKNYFFVYRGNSEAFAHDLHSYNQLMLCEASVASRQGGPSSVRNSGKDDHNCVLSNRGSVHIHQNEALSVGMDNKDEEEVTDNLDDDDDQNIPVSNHVGLSVAEQQVAVGRVLDGVLKRYSHAVEMINYVSLLRISKEDAVWKDVLNHAETFSRMQSILHCWEGSSLSTSSDSFSVMNWGEERVPVTKSVETDSQEGERGCPTSTTHPPSLSDVLNRREAAKNALVTIVFTDEIKNALTHALELWRAANNLVSNFMWTQASNKEETVAEKQDDRAHRNPLPKNTHSGNFAGRVMDTLLRIQSKLDTIVEEDFEQWANYEKRHEASFLLQLKIIGLSASSALGGEHAMAVRENVLEACQSYIRGWARKQLTYQNVVQELRIVQTQKAALFAQSSVRSTRETEGISTPVAPHSSLPNIEEKINSLMETENSYLSNLHMLKQQLSEVDNQFQEIETICHCFLPEHREVLKSFPSTVLWGILSGEELSLEPDSFPRQCSVNGSAMKSFHILSFPRFRPFERELHLSFFNDIQEEPENSLEPCFPTAVNLSGRPRDASLGMEVTDDQDLLSASFVHFKGGIEFRLWRATKVDANSGSRSLCWLKQYDFRNVDVAPFDNWTEDKNKNHKNANEAIRPEQQNEHLRRRKVRTRLAARIMKEELSYASKCQSSRVVCPKEVFSEPKTCSLYFIAPREYTQQRFRSVKNVLSHIRPLDLTWLHEALQCVLDLHACSCPHGNVRLSNFTYDSFGRVSIALFSPAFSAVQPHASFVPGPPQQKADVTIRAFEQDATDFGIMILSEVLPFIGITKKEVLPSDSKDKEIEELHILRVFKEIGERLVAKVEPKFTLPHARAFVKRCMQIPLCDALVVGKKQGSYFPIEWGLKASTNIMHLDPVHDWPLFVGVNNNSRSFRRMKMYRNVNPFLWELYARYRDEVSNTNPPPPPHRVSQCPQFLFCGDDAEVNERFLWCVCESESEVWRLSYNGIPQERRILSMNKESVVRLPFLSLSNPFKWFENPANRKVGKAHFFLIIFRVVLGRIIEKQEPQQGEIKLHEVTKTLLFYDGEEHSTTVGYSIIPSCSHAVYPELVLRL